MSLPITRSGVAMLTLLLAFPRDSVAQIIPDSTLPNPSTVTIEETQQRIHGGTQAGGNLFHSFDRFNLRTGETALFDNALTVENIITRVTGGQISNIDGLIRANCTTNLFLVNPNGIAFGENARLDVGGSFVASTAESILFADRTVFDASQSDASPLLTVSVPVGLQLGSQPGAIQVRGTGNTQVLDRTISFATTGISGEGLMVEPGRTLALVGGDIQLEGGTLRSLGGNIELRSFRDGMARLNVTSNGVNLDRGTTQSVGDIHLTAAAGLDAGGPAGGSIQLQGRNIIFDDGSIVFARALSEGSSGRVLVNAAESVEFKGRNPFDGQESIAIVGTLGSGDGSNVTINAARLRLQDGALISAPSFGTGDAGDITANATESVEIVGNSVSTGRASSLLASTFSSGRAGNVTVNTGRLSVRDGATIQSSTFGTGPAGEVMLNATEVIEVRGTDSEGTPSRVLADTSISDNLSPDLLSDRTVNRNSGNLFLVAPQLQITDGGSVTVANDGPGNAGNIRVEAGEILLDNRGKLAASTASGIGGNIDLQAGSVILGDRSEISAESGGIGNGGNLNLNAQTLTLLNRSRINANAFEGIGGNIEINARGIFVSPDSAITASSQLGVDGIVQINTPDVDAAAGLVELSGETTDPSDRIVSGCAAGSSFTVTGRGGLVEDPMSIVRGETVWEDWQHHAGNDAALETSSQPIRVTPLEPVQKLVEATGWTIRDDGTVELIAHRPGFPPVWGKAPPCNR